MTVLEIVFVGECEVFGCLDFVHFLFFFFFFIGFVTVSVGECEVFVYLDFVHFFFSPWAAKLIGPRTGCQFFKKKNINFSLKLILQSLNFCIA